MKRVIYLITILALVLALAGCGQSGLVAHEYLGQALDKNKSIKDLQFTGKLTLKGDALYALAENSTFSFAGQLEQEPLYIDAEARIITTLQGMNLMVDFPVLVTDGDLYIKVPPMLKQMMPEFNRDYLLLASSAGSPAGAESTSLFTWLAAAAQGLQAGEVVRVKTKGISFAGGRVNEAIEVRTDRVAGVGPIRELTDLVATLVFDKNDYLRELSFIAQALVDGGAAMEIRGEIDFNKINEGIKNRQSAPSASEFLRYDEILFPPVIPGGK